MSAKRCDLEVQLQFSGPDGQVYGAKAVVVRESQPNKAGDAWTPEAMKAFAEQIQKKQHAVQARVVPRQ